MAGCPAGWFSLNVPSGLTIYWFINNILSTAQQVLAHAALLRRHVLGTACGISPGACFARIFLRVPGLLSTCKSPCNAQQIPCR